MKKNIFGFIAAGSMSMILFGCSATGQNVQSTEKSSMEAMSETKMDGEKTDNGKDMDLSSSKAEDSEDDTDIYDNMVGSESGVVKEINQESILIEKTLENGGQKEDLILNTGASDFYIIDAKTGEIDHGLKVKDKIFAWVGSEYSLSLPPQVNAHVVLTNVANADIPQYTDGIDKVKDMGDQVILKDTERGLEWLFDNSSSVTEISTGNEIGFDNIKKGDKCLIWSEPVKLSENKNDTVKVTKMIVLK